MTRDDDVWQPNPREDAQGIDRERLRRNRKLTPQQRVERIQAAAAELLRVRIEVLRATARTGRS
ncbi:MAG: hypothetical protein ACK4XJ_12050 [Fimbriimonadaceae bacterium]